MVIATTNSLLFLLLRTVYHKLVASGWWLVMGDWFIVFQHYIPEYQPPTTSHQPPTNREIPSITCQGERDNSHQD
jgi:hypothetical protein